MGWMFCLVMMTMGFATKEPLYFVAAGLFGVAGSISFHSSIFRKNKEEK